MSLETFSHSQIDGLLELLVLGMYVDRHLATVEDGSIRSYARAAGISSSYDLDQALSRAIAAIRQRPLDDETIDAHLARISDALGNNSARGMAFHALQEVLASDAEEPRSEKEFATAVKVKFEL